MAYGHKFYLLVLYISLYLHPQILLHGVVAPCYQCVDNKVLQLHTTKSPLLDLFHWVLPVAKLIMYFSVYLVSHIKKLPWLQGGKIVVIVKIPATDRGWEIFFLYFPFSVLGSWPTRNEPASCRGFVSGKCNTAISRFWS